MKKLLMISGLGAVESLAQGKHNAFYSTLEEFHTHWERIDIVAPRVKGQTVHTLFGNVHIHCSPLPLVFHPFFFIHKIVALHRKLHFDLMTVHEFPPFYNGIAAMIISWLVQIPYVLEVMHIPGVPRATGMKERLYAWMAKWFLAFDAHSARAVRVINQKQTKDFLVRAGVPASKIVYMPAFYIDLETFQFQPTEKKYDVVYAARLERNKGIPNLLEAILILRNSKPDIKVCIIGHGPMRREIEHFIEKHHLEGNVELSGWLKGPEDVAAILNRSRVFVNPSLNEGGPRVVLEAMACGVPVVTTRVGLMVDIIKDGENGLFCDWNLQSMAESIDRMLEDSVLQEKCSHAGLTLVRQFERKQAIADYAHALERFAQKRLLVITQKVDSHDQLLGFFIDWLKRLEKDVQLSVLCLQEGSHSELHVPVSSLGKEKDNSKFTQFVNFYRYIFSHSSEYDTVFIHMSPIWIVLGGWYWRLAGKKVVLWYTSGGVTLKLRIASWFASVILTASPESYRLPSSKVVVTGHGVDTQLFKLASSLPSDLNILTIGRITLVKNYEVLIDAARDLKNAGVVFKLTIVGEPVFPKDHVYLAGLKEKIAAYGLGDVIEFRGRVDHVALPALYNKNRAFVHMSKTGSLDKVLLEAMASGLTVVSSSDSARVLVPSEYIFQENDSVDLAEKIKHAFAHPYNAREYVIQHHDLGRLIAKIEHLV